MNIMIDLETMGTKPGSAIIAIGAVMFDTEHGIYNKHFYTNVSLKNCMKHGLTVDADTIYWWMKQDDIARGMLTANERALPNALSDFMRWSTHYPDMPSDEFNEKNWEIPPVNITLWGCGPDFDIALLKCAFDACRVDWPYQFHRYRDVRTVRDFAPDTYDPPSRSNLHNALADAIYEAQIVVDIARLKGVKLL